MESSDIGWTGLALSLSLVAVAFALSLWQGLKLEWQLLVAAVRGLAQLLLVGLALTLIFDEAQPLIWSWIWVAAMLAFAAFTVRRQARQLPNAVPVAFVAHAASVAVCLAVAFGAGMFPLEARTLIPIAGMMIGNSMRATVVTARSVVGDVAQRSDEIEARLALGQSRWDAIRPVIRRGIQLGIIPQIEATRALGIVVLPGAMTGLILAGVDPIDAVQVQVAIMFLILGASAVTTTIVGLFASRAFTTPDHRLMAPARVAT